MGGNTRAVTEIMLSGAPRAGSDDRRGQRSLTGYLLMPRPKDLVKGLLIPTTYLLGVVSVGAVTDTTLVRAAVVLMAVELLVYPARYQWNDIRGFAADQQHPSSAGRGRLPGPLANARRHVGASCAVMAMRLALTGLLILLLPSLDLGLILGFATLGVFGVAIVYETLRAASTGRTGEIPAPLTPGVVSIWITAGAGYAVRGLTGLALAIELAPRPGLAAAATVALWAYGVAFVTSRWALEATAFASSHGGTVTWHARPGQAREHLLSLVRWLPERIDPSLDVKDWAPLKCSTSLTAPWHVAVIVAGAAAAVSGRLLCGPCSGEQVVATAVAGAATTAAVAVGARGRSLLVLVGAVAVLATMVLTGAARPIVGVLPWLLLMGAYLFFTTRTLRRLGRPNVLGVAMAALGSVIGQGIFGRATWEAVKSDSGVNAIKTAA